MELLKDYDCDILYHPGKANNVADALNRKSAIAQLMIKEWILLEEAWDLDFKFEDGHHQSLIAALWIELEVLSKAKMLLQTDPEFQKILKEALEKKRPNFHVTEDGVLKFNWCLCVPNNEQLKEEILTKAHRSNYNIHPGNTKMYQNLRQHFWWNDMKKNIAKHLLSA